MGKAGKRKEMVEDRSNGRVLCEKVFTTAFEKVCVSSVDAVTGRLFERCAYERASCERLLVRRLLCASCV